MNASVRPYLVPLAALLIGCGGSGAPGGAGQPVVGNQDQPDLHLTVDERALSAVLADGQLQVTVPASVADGASGKAHATVELLTLSGTRLAKAGADFMLSAGGGAAVLSLPGDLVAETGVAEAELLVRYTVSAGKSLSRGYRSLFTMLPKVDLRARMPDKLIVGAGAKVRVFAIDPFTNAPRQGVPVRLRVVPVEPAGPAQIIEGLTDAAGSAVLQLPAQDEGTFACSAEAGDGASPMALAESDLTVERSHRVLVTTDKPIYQPGQTMHVRALVLKKPLLDADGKRPLTFEVLDGKGNMVFRKYAETNDFGIAATDFKLATEVNMGHYQIKATVDDTTTTKTVNVERYVLPKFKLATSLDREFYLVGEKLVGVVNARYFFGKAVDGGTVEISAASVDIGTDVFATVSGKTDAEGLFSFELQLPDYLVGQPLEGGGNALVFLTVKVTDTASNVVEKMQSVVVSDDLLDIMAVPESGAVVPGLDNVVYLFATDPLGRPADVTFDVTVDGATVTVEPIGSGVASFAATPAGALAFEVFAETASGDSAAESFSFDPGATPGRLLLRTDRALYRVGDTIAVSALTSAAGGRLFFDVVKDGQTLLTEAVDVVDGLAKVDLDIDPAMVGDVVIEAYQVSADASIERDSKRVFVTDAKGLRVAISADQPTYKPGEQATLSFDVTDAQGKPKVAALGVQIVDEAVYAVTEMKPGLLETYFLVQEALQTPSYEIHGVSFDMPTLVTGDPTDAVAQTKAEAGFAAISSAGLAEISSWSQVKLALPPTLAPHYKAHMDAIAAVLAARVDAGGLTDPAAALAGQTDFYDFWGNVYTMTVSEQWDGWYANVTSRGPDELAGTWDDYATTVLVKQYDWRMWEDGDFGGGMPMAGAADAGTTAPPSPAPGGEEGEVGPRVRKDFPETLYNNPALITDESGAASVTLTMADSITEWRVSALANSIDGALGSTVDGVTVFQDFFVDISFPPTLTRGDEVTFPIALYNYLPTPQTVELTLEPAGWYELAGGTNTASITLDGNQVTSISFPVKVTEVGVHALTVTALGSTMSDAVQRVVRVLPDGVETRDSASGMLDGEVTHAVTYPAEMIPNSQQLLVKVYPGIMAQAVEGLDSLLQMPSGCFEQTTATNWPNTLVLDYLRTSGQVSPEIELKAMDYLQQGYQRLLTFECTGGGYVWFGDPSPANVVLSAMGVLEFSDMAKVIEVDQAMIARTADWLVGAQFADGHWHTDQGSEFATVQYDDVKTTAFAAWALAESPYGGAAVQAALGFLTPAASDPTTDVYSQAMMANAFAAADPNGATTKALLNTLAAKAVVETDGSVHWVYEGASGNYGGGGNGTSIEVTALAVQAFAAAGMHLDLAGQAIAYLAGNKDSFGNWGTTHATILSLRAMIKSLANKTEEGDGTLTVAVGGATVATIAISEENRNVFHQLELADAVATDAPNDVTVSYVGTGNLMYQVVWGYWLPGASAPPVASDALSIDVSYDKTTLAVNDTAVCTAVVTNNSGANLDMVMLDLGVPPGFTVLPDKLEALVAAGTLMKVELAGQQVILYIDKLAPKQALTVSYDLQAKFPVKAKAAGSSAYLYYDTATKAATGAVDFVVE